MPLLPKPYPDEVVGSIFSRALFHSGLPTKQLLASVFGTNRSNTSFLIAADATLTARLAGVSPVELVLEHSMLPYSTAFMPRERQRALLEKALNPRAQNESLASLTKNVTYSVKFKRVCPDCVREDLKNFGESYWRRSHLLPGVLWCPMHGTILQSTTLPLNRHPESTQLCMPHQVATTSIRGLKPRRVDKLVSEFSLAALQGRLTPSPDWNATYRTEALAQNYRLPSGDVASVIFSKVFVEVLGKRLLTEVGYEPDWTPTQAWPAAMVRVNIGVPFSSAKHVLMHAFLATRTGAPADTRSSYKKPGRAARDYTCIDRELSVRLTSLLAEVKAMQVRVTVDWLLDRLETKHLYKHHSKELPCTRKLLAEFRVSDQAQRQLGLRPSSRKRSKKRAESSAAFLKIFTQNEGIRTPENRG